MYIPHANKPQIPAHNRRVASVWCASAARARGMVYVCITCKYASNTCAHLASSVCIVRIYKRAQCYAQKRHISAYPSAKERYACTICKKTSNTCANSASSVCIVCNCKRAPYYVQKSHISAYPSVKERYVYIICKKASNTCARSASSVCVVCICDARTWHVWRTWASSAVMAS